MNEFTVRLDLAKGKARQQQTVFVRQGDKNATTIVATITDHGAAAATSGMTARFAMRLPNGTEYYRKAASLSGNVATVALDEAQAASVAGRTDVAYFQLLQGSTVVASTESFTVVVLPDALAGADVPESYDSAIQDAIDALDAAVADMPDMVEDVLEAHPEWTTTVQDGSITKAKLATDLARDRERLMYRLANMLTAQLPEGETATASDAAKTPMAGLALYGRSTQDGTPTPDAPVAIQSVEGNLLDTVRTGSLTDSGVTWTYHADGTITARGTATANSWSHNRGNRILSHLPAGTYTASVSGSPFGLVVYVDNVTIYNNVLSRYTFTLDTDSDVSVYARVPNGTTVDATTGIMLVSGSEMAPYVPFGNVGLWSRGRNLLDIDALWDDTTGLGVTFTGMGGGEWVASGTASGDGDILSASNDQGLLSLPAGTYKFSGAPSGNSLNTFNLMLRVKRAAGGNVYYASGDTFSLGDGDHVARVYVNCKSGTNMDGKVFRPQIELGTTATAYHPYTATVTPVPLDGHELRSLPDGTRDELTVDERGHAVLVQRVGTATFDGSEEWSLSGGGRVRVNSSALTGLVRRPANNQEVFAAYSDHFVGVTDSESYGGAIGVSVQVSGFIGFTRTGQETTTADWKSWLAANPVTLDYPLATPVTHDLGYVAAVPLCGPDLTAQAIPSAPMQLTYERDLNATLARLESAIADVATS